MILFFISLYIEYFKIKLNIAKLNLTTPIL